MFYWNDKVNNRIDTLSDFTDTFLRSCHLVKMVFLQKMFV